MIGAYHNSQSGNVYRQTCIFDSRVFLDLDLVGIAGEQQTAGWYDGGYP